MAEDVVLVALSGHGQQFEAKVAGENGPVEEAFFCPSDAVSLQPTTLIGMTELLQILGAKGGKNLVLVDACRDDPSRGGIGVAGNAGRHIPANTAVLFSCAARQRSFETHLMFGPNSPKGHGIFFHRILTGLRGDAKNDHGEVTWDRLSEYVKETVNEDAVKWFPERAMPNAANQKVVQTPHAIGSLVGKSPVLVKLAPDGTLKPAAAPTSSANNARLQNDRKENKVLAPVLADNPSWKALPGVYRTKLADGRWLLLCVTRARIYDDTDTETVCRNKMAKQLLEWSQQVRVAVLTQTEDDKVREIIRTEAKGYMKMLAPMDSWPSADGKMLYVAYAKLFGPGEIAPK